MIDKYWEYNGKCSLCGYEGTVFSVVQLEPDHSWVCPECDEDSILIVREEYINGD